MQDPLSPHLLHQTSSAWFQPLTLMAGLPVKMSEIQDDLHQAAVIHENTHYLQATTTFFGIYRFLSMWQSLTAYARMRSDRKGDPLGEAEIAALEKEHQENLEKLSYFHPHPSKDVPADGFEGTGEMGPRWLELPDGQQTSAYCKRLENGDLRLFFLDAQILQESMAMALALEQWYGFNPEIYAKARESTDPELFIYAAGAETVRELTEWEESDAVWWVTYTLCDFALNHLASTHVFFHGARLIGQQWPEPPEVDQLEAIYQFLIERFEFEEVDQARQEIFAHIHERLKKRLEQPDPFDSALYSLLGVMDSAIRLRAQRPHLFALFPLRELGNKHFIQQFHMPLFTAGKQVSSLSADSDRAQGVLFLTTAFHRLFSVVAKAQTPPECPLARLDACGLDRSEHCWSGPWLRSEPEPGEGCLYRFVDDGFDRVPQSSSPDHA